MPTPSARPSFRFTCRGVSLAHPVDRMPEGYYPVLQNVRMTQQGDLDVRQGTTKILRLGDLSGGSVSPVHTIRRLNNVDSTFGRLTGEGDKLFWNETPLDWSFSGNPLSLVPFRPNRSPNPYMYVGDSKQLRKISPAGKNYQTGITPPLGAPDISLTGPCWEMVVDTSSTAGWGAIGTAGAASSSDRFTDVAAQVLYDYGTTGWASVVPSGTPTLQPGAIIAIGANNYPIRDITRAIHATTIAAIIYDPASTTCSVCLTDNSPDLAPNSILDFNGEYVRVLDLIEGRDGKTAFRCQTQTVHTAGETVNGHIAFRAYFSVTFTAGTGFTATQITSTVATGAGSITSPVPASMDSITPPDGTGKRPVTADDYIHVSLKFDLPDKLSALEFQLDVSDGSLTKDYLTYVVDLSTTRIQPDEWLDVLVNMSTLYRSGTDYTKSLGTAVLAGVTVVCTADVQVSVSSWWVGGTYGLDVTPAEAPVQYAYRYRDSRTGATSNPSPYTRTGLVPLRDGVRITVYPSMDSQVDSIDILRFGGGLNNWVVSGYYPNVFQKIVDDLPTSSIDTNEQPAFDSYMPFPVSDLPRAGRCDACGSTLAWRSGDKFNINWVPGSIVIVNGVACTVYQVTSKERMQLVQSPGAGGNLPFTLPEATIAGFPLPVLWAYGGQGTGTFVFGVGDPYNPGFLRWCKGNDPDAASDTGNLEVTSPSEPLMNGCTYDGRSFVFSTERLFAIFPNFGTLNYGGIGQTFSATTGNLFTAQVVESGTGLFSRYALDVTPYGIAWVGKDGIYLFTGNAPLCITNDDLYPLFPHGGVTPGPVNGYAPPDFSKPEHLRLSFADNSLFFTFLDTTGNHSCFRFDFAHKGWFPYNYQPPATIFYQEEGESVDSVLVGSDDGNVRQFSKTSTDDGAPIVCRLRTPSMDNGESRAMKYYIDAMLDFQAALTYLIGFNNFTINGPSSALVQTTRNQSVIDVCLNDGDNLSLYRNIAIDLTWNAPGKVYEFQPNMVDQPLLVDGLVAQYGDNGIPNYSHTKEGWVEMIAGADVTLEIWVDGVRHQITIPSTNGRFARQHFMTGPLKGKAWLYKLTCPQPFIPFSDGIVVMVKMWGSNTSFFPFHPFSPSQNTLGEGRAYAAGIPT